MAEITLQTATRRNIPNEQISEISPFELSQFNGFQQAYGAVNKLRAGPTPFYNCHGLTFASRRTGIFDDVSLRAILADDNYTLISREAVLPGDVILYYAESGEIDHSGIVIEPPTAATFWVPLVYSKWGKFSEFIHFGNRCPYDFSAVRYYRVAR
jgi:hypothetical protein